MARKPVYEKDSGFNLAVIVFTRRSINDTLAICRVDRRTSILRPRRDGRSRYQSYNSVLTREKQSWLLIDSGACTWWIYAPAAAGREPV